MKLKDKLFIINKRGNYTNNLIVASNFLNKKEIEEYKEINDVDVYEFTNKKGSKRLYTGDVVGYWQAMNDYKARIF